MLTGITPACAGNTKTASLRGRQAQDHPRLRGEYQNGNPAGASSPGSPPLARGIQTDSMSEDPRRRDHPRLRGEYLAAQSRPHRRKGSPPLARGILTMFFQVVEAVRITPACAGNTKKKIELYEPDGDHPRLRGEYSAYQAAQPDHKGSPPLARGILNTTNYSRRRAGLTPACAGNTNNATTVDITWWDHPRLRGEYEPEVVAVEAVAGSPPLARGIPIKSCIWVPLSRITPACAGNTGSAISAIKSCIGSPPLARGILNQMQTPAPSIEDHPRLRGEYHPHKKRCAMNTGITPACAGNTLSMIRLPL